MSQMPPQYNQPQMQPYGAPPKGTSGLAVGSLICSLILCCPGLGLIGVILGLAAIPGTGAGRKSGRGLAVAGIIIGLLSTALWVGVPYAGYRWFHATIDAVGEPVNRFVDDYNAGNDQALYDRMGGQATGESFEQFSARMQAARAQYGKAERIEGLFNMLTSGGVEIAQTNNDLTARLPLQFEKVGQRVVELRFRHTDNDWQLRGVDLDP